MAPKTPEEIKVGMQYKGPISGTIYTITEIDYGTKWCTYSTPNGRTHRNPMTYLISNFKYVEKPLDKATKTLDEFYRNIPKVCKHTNIKKDTWFTSKVYKHCADCGVAID